MNMSEMGGIQLNVTTVYLRSTYLRSNQGEAANEDD